MKKKGRGILLKLNSEDAAQFIFEAIARTTCIPLEKWFGRNDRANVRRMLLSVINRDNEIVLWAAKTCEHTFEDDTVEEVEVEARATPCLSSSSRTPSTTVASLYPSR